MRIPSARLVAVADSNESLARAVAQKFEAGRSFQNYMSLLECSDVDAVDICTPTRYHAEIAAAAAKAGKHVLCEKPIALTLEDADRIIDACSRNKVKLMIAHSRRFIPRYSLVRESIGAGSIGRPVWITQISRRTIVQPGSWYFNRDMTLGPIAEVGIHEADLLRWMLSDDVKAVRGIATLNDSTGIYEQVFAALKFRKGAVASFEVGYVLPATFPQYTTLEVLGTGGWISATDTQMNVVTEGAQSGITYPLAYPELLSVNSAYERELIAFVDSVLSNSAPPVTGAEARAALEIILAVVRSIQTHRPVKLPFRR